jgi:hypothetical protein
MFIAPIGHRTLPLSGGALLMRKIAAGSLLLLTAACGSLSTVRAISADAHGVTFEFADESQDDVTRQAMLYCANLGHSAVLESSRPEGDGGRIAIYDCR